MKRILSLILVALLGLFGFAACKEDTPESSSTQTSLSIEFVQNEITLAVGTSAQAEVVTSKNVFVFWEIRDANIATVSNGTITGVAEGQTICYAYYGDVRAMCLIKVTAVEAEPLLSISTPYTEGVTLYVGDVFDVMATAKLGNAVVDEATMDYTVENSAVASVENGVLTAVGAGSTTLEITASHAGQTAILKVTVTVLQKQ